MIFVKYIIVWISDILLLDMSFPRISGIIKFRWFFWILNLIFLLTEVSSSIFNLFRLLQKIANLRHFDRILRSKQSLFLLIDKLYIKQDRILPFFKKISHLKFLVAQNYTKEGLHIIFFIYLRKLSRVWI